MPVNTWVTLVEEAELTQKGRGSVLHRLGALLPTFSPTKLSSENWLWGWAALELFIKVQHFWKRQQWRSQGKWCFLKGKCHLMAQHFTSDIYSIAQHPRCVATLCILKATVLVLCGLKRTQPPWENGWSQTPLKSPFGLFHLLRHFLEVTIRRHFERCSDEHFYKKTPHTSTLFKTAVKKAVYSLLLPYLAKSSLYF